MLLRILAFVAFILAALAAVLGLDLDRAGPAFLVPLGLALWVADTFLPESSGWWNRRAP